LQISGKKHTTDQIIPDALDLLDMIDFRETNLTDAVKKINNTVKEVNSVIDWVKTNIIQGKRVDDESWTQKYAAFIEYLILYVVATLSVSSALGYFIIGKTDWASVGIIATVMSSTILLGSVKHILNRLIRRKTMKIESLEETNKALETALAAQSIERTKEQSRFQRLYEHVKRVDPHFSLETLYMEANPPTPQKIKPLTIKKFCEDQQDYEKQKKKPSDSL